MLNRTQKIILGIGAACLVALTLWVPWRFRYRNESYDIDQAAGYSFVTVPPVYEMRGSKQPRVGAHIDTQRIVAPASAVIVLVAAGLWLAKSSTPP